MVVLDANIRDIIGSFHPSRPILTNAEIYRKISMINPMFSIYRLYLRYIRWHSNKMEETELYKELQNYRYYAQCNSYTDKIIIYAPLGYSSDGIIDLLKSKIDEEGLTYFDTVDDVMQIEVSYGYSLYDNLYNALLIYIRNIISKPLYIKPYVTTTYNLYYSHVEEPPGDADLTDEEIDEYVNRIQELDREFSLSRLYYIIHEQYIRSKDIDINLIPIVSQYLDILTHITYDYYNMDRTITLWNNKEQIYIIDNANRDMFVSIISNIYHGINTSELDLNLDNRIEYDTYYETEGFKDN